MKSPFELHRNGGTADACMEGSNSSHTPKTDNKRRLASDSFDCSHLQRSLKRVRLLNIGLLRLEKDIRNAVHHHNWTEGMEQTEWRWCDEQSELPIKLSAGSQSMELVLHIGPVFRYTLNFPPIYPHRPPTIMANTGAQLVIATRPDQKGVGMNAWIIQDWSPCFRLTDVCDWVVAFHKEHYENNPFLASESFFQPGRFNVGYDQSASDSKEPTLIPPNEEPMEY